jgi:hypothetical protein
MVVLMLSAIAQVHLHCRGCRGAHFFCPTCGSHDAVHLPAQLSPPCSTSALCPDCSTFITLQVVGFRLNPTGDTPVSESTLSDKLPSLARALQQPPAARPTPTPATPAKTGPTGRFANMRRVSLPWEQDGPSQPTSPLRFTAEDQRFSLSQWAQKGARLPLQFAPATIAAAFRRVYGRNPPKRRQSCLYTKEEMQQLNAYLRGQG